MLCLLSLSFAKYKRMVFETLVVKKKKEQSLKTRENKHNFSSQSLHAKGMAKWSSYKFGQKEASMVTTALNTMAKSRPDDIKALDI